MDETLLRLQKLLDIPDEKIEQYQNYATPKKRFASTPLLLSMNDEELAKFAVVRPYFPGVDIHTQLVRHYPYSDLASLIGYVGVLTRQKLIELPLADTEVPRMLGKLGIESSYENELHGKTGYAEIETNVQARLLNTLKEVTPEPGAKSLFNAGY